jgi:uncharacterized secreted protein with C-terminal beta-propeller domain
MKLFGILAALLLVVGAAVALGDDDDGSPSGGPIALGDVRLVSVEGCDELLEWFRATASDIDSMYLGGGFAGGGDVLMARESMATAEDSSAGAAPNASGSPATTLAALDEAAAGYSTTNVQERDVDEPDTVKTDGDVLVLAGAEGLRIVDVGDGTPALLSTVPLEQGASEIILSGDRVLALTTTYRTDPDTPVASSSDDSARLMIMPMGEEVTVLTSVDISDPANPQVVETRELPGAYRSARAVGDAARIVLVSYPTLPQPGPAVYESGDEAEIQRRLEEWKAQAIEAMTLEDWSPNAGDCSSVARTVAPQGLGTTTVLTLDLQGSLAELDRDSVVADAGTVYASPEQLVIATSRWSQALTPEGGSNDVSTELHAFDITDPATTTYTGSGSVPGYLLNQFALSSHEGNLRVATTEEAPWDEATGTSQSDSGITVLDGSMQQIGRIDGLGVTERIQAVRYMGDVAYVVTFRQTDPLYAIDLSDPRAPRVAGELKVPGYSAYLHPVASDGSTLLGVGQDATDDGQQLGTKVATYDVSAIDAPSEIASVRIDRGSSAVEWDHRAFLWWPTSRVAVIPVDVYDESGAQPYTGAVAFDVDESGAVVERGRVSHQGHVDPNGWWPSIQRTVVVGDSIYTISEAGVLKSSLSSLADEGFVAFPLPSSFGGRPMPIEGDDGGIGSTEPAPAVDPPTPDTTVPPDEG